MGPFQCYWMAGTIQFHQNLKGSVFCERMLSGKEHHSLSASITSLLEPEV